MRKSLLLAAVPVAAIAVAAAVAIGKHGVGAKSPDKFDDDLKQAQAAGLDLAQAQTSKKFAFTEIAQTAAPAPSKVVKPGNGNKAVRSQTPTTKAAPETEAAPVLDPLPEVQVIENAPAPTTTVATVPAVPRPEPQTSPMPEPDQGPILAGGSGRGTGHTDGGGIGIGTIIGSIIRGGVVDGDNCDPRSHGGGMGRPVYSPNPNAGSGRIRPGFPISTGPMSPSGGSSVMRPRGR